MNGLWPADDSGDTQRWLFKHRCQYVDVSTNHLVYYQYEAKRFPHVIMLDKIGLASCAALPRAITESPSSSASMHGRRLSLKSLTPRHFATAPSCFPIVKSTACFLEDGRQ